MHRSTLGISGQASPGPNSGHGVAKHAGSLLYVGQVSTRIPKWGLVINAKLESSRTQVHVGADLGLDVGSGSVGIFRNNVTVSHAPTGDVDFGAHSVLDGG